LSFGAGWKPGFVHRCFGFRGHRCDPDCRAFRRPGAQKNCDTQNRPPHGHLACTAVRDASENFFCNRLMSSPMAKRHGIRKSTKMVELIIPPIVGVAMGFMISMPGPVESMMGSSDKVVAATVISFGRSRKTETSSTASIYDL